MSDGWPNSHEDEGKYFGFTDDNADLFFGTEAWDQTSHQVVTSDGVEGEIFVWRDNTNCQMSCGRWNPISSAQGGDWATGMTISFRNSKPERIL